MHPPDTAADLLALSLLPGIGPRRFRELRSRSGVAALLRAPEGVGDLLSGEEQARIRSGGAQLRAEAELSRCRALGIDIVGLDDPAYPEGLRQAYDPPPVLYVRGRPEALGGRRAVAVVGCRGASPTGAALARRLARELTSWGLTVVSGLARGIDTAAHLGALDAGGPTIAVQGRGLDGTYPAENQGLADRIVAGGGALVSECPLGVGPLAENFPRRNRIIATVTEATVVVEAAKRSGALITARCAAEEGRDVMAVPGHPADERSFGPNALIRDGAVLVRDADDVAQELGLEPREPAPPQGETGLLALLADGQALDLETLAEKSRQPLPAVLAALATLEIDARVRRLPGPLFVKA